MKNNIAIFGALLLITLSTGLSTLKFKETSRPVFIVTDTLEKSAKPTEAEAANTEDNLKLYKKNVMATYYADKFNGRKTSSGDRFHNSKLTAAHMKLPFGTKVRVTNEANGKSIDVKVNDRGPYSRKMEIDLSKKAYMAIASNKGAGSFKVKIEIIDQQL